MTRFTAMKVGDSPRNVGTPHVKSALRRCQDLAEEAAPGSNVRLAWERRVQSLEAELHDRGERLRVKS